MSRLFISAAVYMRRLQVMTVKEFLQLFRDIVLFGFIIYAFTLDIYIAGSGVSLQLKDAALYTIDNDKSAASRELVSRFKEPEFKHHGELARVHDAAIALDEGQAMAVLDIPPDFQTSLLSGRRTPVQIQIDTTNSVLGFLASSYARQITEGFGFELALSAMGSGPSNTKRTPVIDDRHRVFFNPNQNDAWFMTISELLTIITLFSILLPAAAMVREKEKGTVEQLLVSPLSPFQIMFPKILSMTAVILVGSSITLFFILKGIFHIPLRGSITLFFAVTTLYVFTTAGLGLFIATVSRNLAQVGMITVLIFIPMLFLSGAWTPPEAMPGWMKIFMFLSPLHYYIDTGFGILLKGAGLRLLWPEILSIGTLGGLLFGLGIWRFRNQFE